MHTWSIQSEIDGHWLPREGVEQHVDVVEQPARQTVALLLLQPRRCLVQLRIAVEKDMIEVAERQRAVGPHGIAAVLYAHGGLGAGELLPQEGVETRYAHSQQRRWDKD